MRDAGSAVKIPHTLLVIDILTRATNCVFHSPPSLTLSCCQRQHQPQPPAPGLHLCSSGLEFHRGTGSTEPSFSPSSDSQPFLSEPSWLPSLASQLYLLPPQNLSREAQERSLHPSGEAGGGGYLPKPP